MSFLILQCFYIYINKPKIGDIRMSDMMIRYAGPESKPVLKPDVTKEAPKDDAMTIRYAGPEKAADKDAPKINPGQPDNDTFVMRYAGPEK